MQNDDALIARIHGRDWCPVALPWFGFARRRDALSALRREAYASAARRHRVPRALRVARYALTWPLLAARNTHHAVAAWGGAVQALDGLSRSRQFRDLFWLALTENVSPETYYVFGLWRAAHRPSATRYLQEFEVIWLCDQAHAALDPGLIQNKLRFLHACREQTLPVVPVLAAFAAGGDEHWFTARETPAGQDLFVKPIAMSCGTGAERWRHDPATGTWHRRGEHLDWSGLLARLRGAARPGGMLLQPFVANHPDQAQWSSGGLATLRVLACRPPGERARAIACSWRMPVGDADADNYSAGGISAPVAPDGTIGLGRCRRIGSTVDTHPDTGARFTGAPLPGFATMRDLALEAHDRLGFDGFVGWDIALGANGPLLVEGNPTWGPTVIQAPHDAPLGDTEVPDLFARLLARGPTRPSKA